MPQWLQNPFRAGGAAHSPRYQQPQQSSIHPFVNAVYYPNWRIYRQQAPSSLNLGFLSHVFYAFAWPNADGTLSLSDEYADTEIEVDGVHGCIAALVKVKEQYSHVKIVISIGGGGQGSANFPRVAGSDLTRHVFARSVKDFVDMHGFDGVDIDWEHPSDPQQGADYISLLAALRQFLPAPTYVLTSALPAGEWALRNINIAHASTYLTFINLMTYDFSGPWVDKCGSHAQLFTPKKPHNDAACLSGSSAVSYAVNHGVPSTKLLLGVPCYGRSFLGASRPGQSYQGTGGEEGTFEYKDLPRPGTQEAVDKDTGAAYCVGGDGGFVSYDNPQTVRMKADFVREYNLAGMFYWTGTGDVKGKRSLIENGYKALHNI